MINDEKRKILIVDDVFQIRYNLCQFFQGYGYTALEAKGGLRAMEVCERFVPSLIILDYNLRDIECFQFLDWLRKYENNLKDVVQINNIPVIIISGYINVQQIKHDVNKYGVASFMRKPLNFNELLNEVVMALGEDRKFHFPMTRSVVILDSESRTAKFLTGYLEQLGLNVYNCPEPADLTEIISDTKPDCVILDCFAELGKYCKFDVYEFVKKHNPKARIFFTTFCASCKLINSFKLIGINDIFFKPLDLTLLRHKVLEGLDTKNSQVLEDSLKSLLSSVKPDK
jgi:CheY-like chemotaxis protein